MTATLEGVTRFWMCPAGAVALRAGELVLLTADGSARVLARGVTAACLSPSGATAALAAEAGGAVRAIALDGSGERAWPAVRGRVQCIAADDRGRVAVGTRDDRALFGSPEGTWLGERALEPVAPSAQDLVAPGVRAVGLLPSGEAVAISGWGRVRLLGPDLSERWAAQVEALAYYEDPVEVVPLLGGGFLVASDRLAVALSRGGQVRGPPGGGLGFSGDRLAFLEESGIAFLSDDGARARAIPAPEGARCVDRDGDLLAVGCADGALIWLSAEDGTELDAVEAAPCAVLEVRVAHGLVAARDAEGTLRVWSRGDARRARPRPAALPAQRIFELGQTAWSARWSPNGESIGARGPALAVYSASEGRERARWSGADPMELWSSNGRWIAYFRQQIQTYDGASLEPRGGGPVGRDNLSFLAEVPSGALLSSSAGLVLVGLDGKPRAIDTGARVKGGSLHHSPSRVAVSPDGARVAVSPVDRRGLVLSLPDGRWLSEPEPVNGAWRFSPDGALLLDCDSGAILTREGAPVGGCGRGRRGASSWSPDGQWIARSEPDGAWLARRDGAEEHPLEGAAGALDAPLFSPDGRRVAAVLPSAVVLLDVESGALVRRVETGRGMFASFASPERLLLWPRESGAADPTHWLIDVRSGELVARLTAAVDGPEHWDSPVALHGRVLIASLGQAPWLFDLEDGALLGRLPIGEGVELRSIEVSAQGELLALTEDGTARIWSPPIWPVRSGSG